MSTYNLDPSKAKEGSGRVSNRINETGAYIGQITCAKKVTAKTGTEGIELTFKSNEGLEASYLTLWTKNAAGESIFGEKQLHALMTCLKIKTITSKEAQVKEWDPASRTEITVLADVYPELMNRPIGLVLQLEEYESQDGIKEKMTYFTAFEAMTKKLAAEVLEQKPAEQLEKILKNIKDKRLKPKAENVQEQVNNGGGSFDDDIPFAPLSGKYY